MTLFTKSFMNEKGLMHQLEYCLLIYSAETGEFYGVEIRKTDAMGNVEAEQVEGLCENREETEKFIEKLAEGQALPMELSVLCDDFVSEREMFVS